MRGSVPAAAGCDARRSVTWPWSGRRFSDATTTTQGKLLTHWVPALGTNEHTEKHCGDRRPFPPPAGRAP